MEGERAPTDTMVPSTLVWDEEKVVELYHRIMNVTGDGRGGRAGRSQRSLGSEDVRLVRLMILWKGLPADPPAEVRLQSCSLRACVWKLLLEVDQDSYVNFESYSKLLTQKNRRALLDQLDRDDYRTLRDNLDVSLPSLRRVVWAFYRFSTFLYYSIYLFLVYLFLTFIYFLYVGKIFYKI
jgi:hypothetical protein